MIKSEQEKRDKKIIKSFLEGESIRLLAAKFGLYPQRIYQILKENKISVDKRFDK